MPFDPVLPPALERRGWKVKIRERERVEPPHVTVIRRTRTWRFGLGDRRSLDRLPPAREVPAALGEHLLAHFCELRQAWDRMCPENPVGDD